MLKIHKVEEKNKTEGNGKCYRSWMFRQGDLGNMSLL